MVYLMLLILVIAIGFLVWGKFTLDIVALISLLSLYLTGILDATKTQSGFSNLTVVLMASIATLTAISLNLSPATFAMVIAISAPKAFLTPIGAMTMSAGYKSPPLSLMLIILSLISVPIIWPFLNKNY